MCTHEKPGMVYVMGGGTPETGGISGGPNACSFFYVRRLELSDRVVRETRVISLDTRTEVRQRDTHQGLSSRKKVQGGTFSLLHFVSRTNAGGKHSGKSDDQKRINRLIS